MLLAAAKIKRLHARCARQVNAYNARGAYGGS